jgi:glycerol kinase
VPAPIPSFPVVTLDAGTTFLKAGALSEDGALGGVVARPAPPLRRDGLMCEGSAEEYLAAATNLLQDAAAGRPAGTRLGLASQRSTFLVWDRKSSAPLTPLISWQDRRAAAWCERHAPCADTIARKTGLRLSPHYLGPKLAVLREADSALARRLDDGSALAGTLDLFLLWNWTGGRVAETDLTMAARTLLVCPTTPDWSDELLKMFDLSRGSLGQVVSTADRNATLDNGLVLNASVADQAAATLAYLGDTTDALLVNLGTGGFVMRPMGTRFEPAPGYLCGPMLGAGPRILYALEGTLNGAGASVDAFGAGPTPLPERDPEPDAFCLPDQAGIGAPHWRADRGFTLSLAAQRLEPAGARRVVLEGIVFRVREMIEDMEHRKAPARRIVLSGGLARDAFVAPALAAALDRPVERPAETEATLLGAARLAAGLPLVPARSISVANPARAGAYLRDKFTHWKAWVQSELVP